MKAFLFTIWGACLSMAASAQNQQAVVLHCTGLVQYFKPQSNTPARVYPGLELQTNGKIRCQKGGSAKLLFNGNTFIAAGGRLQDISEIVKASQGVSEMSFTGRFWSFITESVQESESTEKLQQYHRRYMTKTSAGIKGYAEHNYDIATSLLTAGKLPAATVTFKWRNTAGTGPYSFRLMQESGNIVAQILTSDTILTLDLEQLAMNFQEEYRWNVTRNEGKTSSASIPFELTTNNAEKAQKTLGQQSDFQKADPTEQRLMTAYYLEEENCFYNAGGVYEKLLTGDPNNVLLHRLYAAFLARMNMLPESYQMISH